MKTLRKKSVGVIFWGFNYLCKIALQYVFVCV